MKPGRLLLLLAFVFLGIIIYLNKCNNPKNQSAAPGASKQIQPIAVSGVVVYTQSVEDKIYTSGTVLANEEVIVSNEIAGKIISINFKEGTAVKKGDLLLKIYDEDLKVQLKKLQLQKEIASKNEERQKDLLQINGISRQDYELALNQLNSIDADIELLRAQISKTEIRAPFDGMIGLKSVSVGANLPSNIQIASIQQNDPLKIEFSIPERFRNRLSTGSAIRFKTESAPGDFTATIYAFESKVNLQTRSVMVHALCPNKNFKLVPGGFAHIEIPLNVTKDAILIPTQALIPEIRGQKVFIASDGKAKKINVEVGIRSDSTVQITSGLNAGDTIIITGIMQMRPDMPLKIKVLNAAPVRAQSTIN